MGGAARKTAFLELSLASWSGGAAQQLWRRGARAQQEWGKWEWGKQVRAARPGRTCAKGLDVVLAAQQDWISQHTASTPWFLLLNSEH